MNHNRPLPEDRGRPADGVSPQRLADIEQRLKRARPRPADLDLDVIVRSARPDEPPVALPEPSGRRQAARSYRSMGTIAGAWVSGATAGVLATLLLVHREPPVSHPQPPAAPRADAKITREPSAAVTSADETPHSGPDDRPAERPGPRAPSPSRPESMAAVMLPNWVLDHDAARAGDRPVLRAGALAPGLTAATAAFPDDLAGEMPQDGESPPGPVDGASSHGFAPRAGPMLRAAPVPSLARDRLFQELLGTYPSPLL